MPVERRPDWLDPIPQRTAEKESHRSYRPELLSRLVCSVCVLRRGEKEEEEEKKGQDKENETKQQHQHMMKLPASGFASVPTIFLFPFCIISHCEKYKKKKK